MHKASQVKVIYGLDPVFESGSTCIIKVQSPIAYGTKQESNLAERNLEITKHVSFTEELNLNFSIYGASFCFIIIIIFLNLCFLGMQSPKHDSRILQNLLS